MVSGDRELGCIWNLTFVFWVNSKFCSCISCPVWAGHYYWGEILIQHWFLLRTIHWVGFQSLAIRRCEIDIWQRWNELTVCNRCSSMICIFEWKRESQLKCKKCFSSTGKRDQHWLEEEGSPWQWFVFCEIPINDSLPCVPSLPPLLLRCSSTTFNLGSNCRTKLISYSNVRLGGEALRPTPTTHLTLSITVSSSCNSLNTAAISTLAPNPAVARRHLTKYGKFNYVYR